MNKLWSKRVGDHCVVLHLHADRVGIVHMWVSRQMNEWGMMEETKRVSNEG